MKKFARILCLIILSAICLAGCSKEIEQIKLPDADNISEINIEMIDGTEIICNDSERIKQVMSLISTGIKTNRASVQDSPTNYDYGQIDIKNNGGITTAFFYNDNGKYFIEQPYTGIFEVDFDLDKSFTKLK